MSNGIEVHPVSGPALLRRFIEIPAKLYAGDPAFVPPLLLERRESFSPSKNPYFHHAETQFFIAVRDGQDVGRISAQSDRLQSAEKGQFGCLAAIDDGRVFAALFAAAEGWLRERGKRTVMGPFSLSINEETGLLVDGFDTPPMLFMGHDPRYLGPHVEAQGYARAKDVIAYLYDIEHPLPAAAQAMLARKTSRAMTVRNLDMTRYAEEMNMITSIFNDAWSGNWGFVPFTEAEIAHLATSLKLLIDPKWVAICEVRGLPIAFGIAIPNLNEWIADFGGKLMPLNWMRLLWRMKVTGAKTARVPLMGVRRSYSRGLSGGVAPFLIIDKMRSGLRSSGVKQVELSWILEDNKPMRAIIEALGADPYKTYRVYEKAIA